MNTHDIDFIACCTFTVWQYTMGFRTNVTVSNISQIQPHLDGVE